MEELSLRLNNLDSLVIVSYDVALADADLYARFDLYYKNKKEEIHIGTTSALNFTQRLIDALRRALQYNFLLDDSLVSCVGYYWNEIFADREQNVNLKFKIVDNMPVWVGFDHYLFGATQVGSTIAANNMLSAWLYNNDKGAIILEVTELFYWDAQESKAIQETNCQSFMKELQPAIETVITPSYGKKLLKNLIIMHRLFKRNTQTYGD